MIGLFYKDRTDAVIRGWSRVSTILASVIVLLFALLVPIGAQAQDGRSYLELSGGFKTGDFGTPIRTNVYYVNSVLGYVSSTYDLSVSVPYLTLKNSGSVPGMMDSSSGIGDVILRGGRVLVPEGGNGFSLDGSLGVKLPTADDTKGLGSGEADYGAFLGLHQRLGQFLVSFSGGYIKIGDPPQTNYNDIFLYGIGVSRSFNRTNLSLSFQGRQAVIPGAQDPQEIVIDVFHALNSNYALKGGAFEGLNKGGPDAGFNFGIVRWF